MPCLRTAAGFLVPKKFVSPTMDPPSRVPPGIADPGDRQHRCSVCQTGSIRSPGARVGRYQRTRAYRLLPGHS